MGTRAATQATPGDHQGEEVPAALDLREGAAVHPATPHGYVTDWCIDEQDEAGPDGA